MANINITVEEFICQKPEIYDFKYKQDAENVYLLSWNSLGTQYQALDPSTKLLLEYSVDGAQFEYHPANPVAFDAVNFEINFNDLLQTPPFDELRVRLTLETSYCQASEEAAVVVVIV